jgi:hypothetical protein
MTTGQRRSRPGRVRGSVESLQASGGPGEGLAIFESVWRRCMQDQPPVNAGDVRERRGRVALDMMACQDLVGLWGGAHAATGLAPPADAPEH